VDRAAQVANETFAFSALITLVFLAMVFIYRHEISTRSTCRPCAGLWPRLQLTFEPPPAVTTTAAFSHADQVTEERLQSLRQIVSRHRSSTKPRRQAWTERRWSATQQKTLVIPSASVSFPKPGREGAVRPNTSGPAAALPSPRAIRQRPSAWQWAASAVAMAPGGLSGSACSQLLIELLDRIPRSGWQGIQRPACDLDRQPGADTAQCP
jgi:hypothetical protein